MYVVWVYGWGKVGGKPHFQMYSNTPSKAHAHVQSQPQSLPLGPVLSHPPPTTPSPIPTHPIRDVYHSAKQVHSELPCCPLSIPHVPSIWEGRGPISLAAMGKGTILQCRSHPKPNPYPTRGLGTQHAQRGKKGTQWTLQSALVAMDMD